MVKIWKELSAEPIRLEKLEKLVKLGELGKLANWSKQGALRPNVRGTINAAGYKRACTSKRRRHQTRKDCVRLDHEYLVFSCCRYCVKDSWRELVK